MRTTYRAWTGFLATTLAAGLLLWVGTAGADEPARMDYGSLIVLDVYGSYREMGRRAAELLGEDARRVYELDSKLYRRTLPDGLGSRLFDRVVLPISVWFMSDDTGVMEEAAGYAEALGVSRAVESHLGQLDAERGARILQDRSGHDFPNASVVGNLFVLNAAIVEAAGGLLWHSDELQPYAPFGRYLPFAIADAAVIEDPIPASSFLESDAYRREAAPAHYEATEALMDEVPESTFYDARRGLASEGRRRALAPKEVELSWWATHVPR